MNSVDESFQSFRRASRGLFNGYFRPQPSAFVAAWEWEERFCAVEAELFEQLVSVPNGLELLAYGSTQQRIAVTLRHGTFAPIMVNREIDGGYWDHPLREVTRDVELRFVRFFDWDLIGVRDHQYVRVVILAWPENVEAAGKHALIEAQYVSFSAA